MDQHLRPVEDRRERLRPERPGDLTYVELPSVGDTFEKGQEFGTLDVYKRKLQRFSAGGEAARRESRCMAGRGSRSGICIVRDWGVLACKGGGGVRMISLTGNGKRACG